MLELVRLRRERAEPGQQEVVDRARGEHGGQQPAGARGEDLRRGEARSDPGADAARARDELADRLLHLGVVRRPLVLAVVRLALDERLADEARHLVAGDHARGLERGEAEQREVDRSQLLLGPVSGRRDAADGAEAGEKRAGDGRVGAVGRLVGHR